MNVESIQRALAAAGFNPGPFDGVWGRASIAATKAFQAKRGLKPDGIVGKDTLAALFPGVLKPSALSVEPPWYAEAKRRMGLHEVTNRSALMAWLRSDGKTLGDPAKLPWCGDFVETCIALTLPSEVLPSNPYYALNWAKVGVDLSKGALGAILVFKRPGGGHVGFYAGEDATTVSVLGGNQSNRVSITTISKARLYAIRWPSTYPRPTTGTVARAGGALSTNEA